MKSVEVIQEVHILPRATASHQPGSETRWREATNVRSRVEHISRVGIEPRKVCESRGPARENHPRRPEPRVWEPRTVSRRWNAVSAPSLWARQGGGHRGRRPDHAEKGRTRERVSASSASCLEIAEQCGATCSTGSPPRDQSSPRTGSPLRRVDPSTQKCGDDRDGGPRGNAKALRKGVRQSERIIGARGAMRPTTGAHAHAPGPRQPEETSAREAARPGSQETTAVHGTWCSEGEAGRHLRTKAGHAGDTPVGPGTPSPVPLSQRLERSATQAREYPAMAWTTLAPHLDVAMLAHALRSLNPHSAPGVDRVTWRTDKNTLETNLET